MFGDIYGIEKVAIDHKSRIYLRRFTHAEAGEKLALLNVNGAYHLLLLTKVNDIINEYNLLKKDTSNMVEQKILEIKIKQTFEYIVKVIEVDRQRRITLPKNVADFFDGSVVLKGHGDYLTFEKDKESMYLS